MAISGTLGAMLQGISQQTPSVRVDGQVTSQKNMVSDKVRGLTTRPGANQQPTGSAPGPVATETFEWHNFSFRGYNHQVGFDTGKIIMMNANGNAYTIDLNGLGGYIGTNMAVYIFDEELYLANRDTVVEIESAPDAAEQALVERSVMVSILGGAYGRQYSVTISYSDGTDAVGTYTAPDGSGASDADLIPADYIADQLRISLIAHANWKGTSTAAVKGGVISVRDSAFSMTAAAEDGIGGELVRVAANTAKRVTDLPRFAPHGTLVRITGENANADDFYMRFDAEVATPTVGSHFGTSGVWREHFNTDEVTGFKKTTMPHKLVETSPGNFQLQLGGWQDRRVGDEETNPFPSFVGETIRDINGFQSRLMFVSNSTVAFSRTKIATDFFKQSAAEDTATDAIDILSTSEDDYKLEWIIPFDRDLVIFGSDSQFLIPGGPLTPQNASIVETTKFQADTNVRPVSTGRTILFPFSSGKYTGVKEFYSANSVDANEAFSITETVPQLIVGNARVMSTSTNFSMLAMITSGTGIDLFSDNVESSIWIYQWFFDGEEKLQSSWSKYTLPFNVHNVYFDDKFMQVTIYNPNFGRYDILTLDFDYENDANIPYHVSLDFKRQYAVLGESANGDTELGLSTWIADMNPVFVQSYNTSVPGTIVSPKGTYVSGSNTVYIFDRNVVPRYSTLLVGLKYDQEVEPTMPFARDRNGKLMANTKLTLTEFFLYYEDSGIISADMKSKYRTTTRTFTNDSIILAGDPDDPLGVGIRTGVFRVPWGERSDWSELKVKSNDVRPMTIREIEWQGQIQNRGRRM